MKRQDDTYMEIMINFAQSGWKLHFSVRHGLVINSRCSNVLVKNYTRGQEYQLCSFAYLWTGLYSSLLIWKVYVILHLQCYHSFCRCLV